MYAKLSNSRENKLLKGFSLIELSVVLVIIAFLISAIMFTTQARIDASRIFVTKKRMQTIVDSLERYVQNYGHLPCPASPTATTDNKNYGWGTGSNREPANCVSAVNLAGSGTDRDLVMGMVPFKTLVPQLNQQIAIDGWGNRFTYIVVEGYTNESNYSETSTDLGDTISICNNDSGSCSGQTDLGDNDDIVYILIGHGDYDHNAYNDKTGNRKSISTCDGSSGTCPMDAENGDSDRVFSFGMPNQDFDDYVIFRSRWQLPEYIN